LTGNLDNEGALELWLRAVTGDREAEEHVVAMALAIAREEYRKRRLGADLAEELAQRSGLTVLTYLRSGKGVVSNLHAFLRWRARGVLSDHVRGTRGKGKVLEVLEVEADLPAHDTTDAVLDGERLAALTECIRTLPNPLRMIIVPYYENGSSLREVAELTGVPRSTAAVRLTQGLSALRNCLRSKGVEAY
jgi:RNA polymerase sigma factor (sigma-70 family)